VGTFSSQRKNEMQERLYLVPYEWKTVFVLFVTFCYKDCFGEPPLRLCSAQCVDRMTVEAAASAALEKLRAARLPPQNYFGASEATRLRRPAFA
jgi:hypothetical protein